MATFIVLGNWTDQGARSAQDTVARAQQVREAASGLGIEMQQIWWTMGRYDVVAIFEAPDDETATALMVAAARAGSVRTETLRAFDGDEVKAILDKVKA
jgi:uncharacterized protein with GYD domain